MNKIADYIRKVFSRFNTRSTLNGINTRLSEDMKQIDTFISVKTDEVKELCKLRDETILKINQIIADVDRADAIRKSINTAIGNIKEGSNND